MEKENTAIDKAEFIGKLIVFSKRKKGYWKMKREKHDNNSCKQ
jgi:hypothetical protein